MGQIYTGNNQAFRNKICIQNQKINVDNNGMENMTGKEKRTRNKKIYININK